MDTTILNFLIKAGFAAVPAVGFGMIFNVPPATLKFCALGGAIGYTSRELLMSYGGISIELGTFIASLLVGITALLLSKKYLIPQPVYAVASNSYDSWNLCVYRYDCFGRYELSWCVPRTHFPVH